MTTSYMTLLQELARLYGVETAYYDLTGQYQQASSDALLVILRALGAPVATLQDVPAAVRERQQAPWQQPLEPVVVVWDGGTPPVEVRLPSSVIDTPLVGHLKLESGEQMSWTWQGADLPILRAAEIEGTRYIAKRLPLPDGLPHGYHRFTLEIPGRTVETLIFAAPLKAYLADESGGRRWGAFIPLYALYHEKSWGSGDFSDFEALMTWVAGMGGSLVGTLPLLATFLDEPFEPSPYSPASRLLWNELYLDITKVPELPRCPSAQALLASSPFQEELNTLRKLPLVDYRRQMALKRQVLEKLCRCCFAEPSDRLDNLRHFAEANTVVEDYARFRAAGEQQHLPWPEWPQPLCDGILKEGDYNEEARRYHLYVQWLAHEQLQALSQKSREIGVGLYIDLPLGVHPYGYDIWRERNIFALGISGGAPPDAFFTEGQNWAFPPLNPEKIRAQGYQYVIACLRHLMKHASILRIDHVMGLHRLFWIPEGMEAKQGVYVHYHPEEFYAILAIESHRNKTIIVGEDLGTVPPDVRPAMSQHGLHRMYILQYECTSDPGSALPAVPADMVASLNTHDMPPFAALWQGLDILDRQGLGLLDEAGTQQELKRRQSLNEALAHFLHYKGWAKELPQNPQAVLRAALAFLSASLAHIILVNLEDLWLETQPQNTPGTWMERPNWRKKARYSFDMFRQLPQVTDELHEINRIRKGEVIQ